MYAQSQEIACRLFIDLLKFHREQQAVDKGVCLYTLDTTPQSWLDKLLSLGLVDVERCERLFTKHPVAVDYGRVYAVFSPDFSL